MPDHFLFLLLAVFTLPVVMGSALLLARGQRSVSWLRDCPAELVGVPPRVSVIIPARDEEKKIETALESVLGQDYPDLEVIVLDDRSTDSTGAILDRMAKRHRRLRVVHIDELPPGWLGKVHALHTGARLAGGSILLFADADVVMRPAAVRRAVAYLLGNGLDHLTVAAEIRAPGPLLDLAVGTFLLGALRIGQPWKARDPKSDRSIGLGAFNMVRREAYAAIGGHRRIAMRPIDDLELGRLLKGRGFRQEMLFGKGAISVEWYASVKEMVHGLRKNAFAATGYRLAPIIVISLFALAMDVWPWIGVFATGGVTRVLNAVIVLAGALSYSDTAGRCGLRRWNGVFLPIGTLIVLYATWASALGALARRGIVWRGTLYPLEELKAGRD